MRQITYRVSLAVLCQLALLLPIVSHAAKEDEPKDSVAAVADVVENKDCLWIPRIDRITVVDKRNVIFYTKGKEVYLNTLNHNCPGLSKNKAIMYRTSLSRLCKIDTITVLDNHGFGFHRGASCGLGDFVAITKEQARELRAKKKKKS